MPPILQAVTLAMTFFVVTPSIMPMGFVYPAIVQWSPPKLTRPLETGFISFNPGILIPSEAPPPNPTWAVTLLGGAPRNTSLDHSFWYNTGGLNYSDSLNLGYDVCAIYLEPLGILNNTDMRAQHDNGSCLTAFDGDCVTALQQQSEDFALQLVGSPTALPNSNLTADSLPSVCDSLAQMMTSALPKECIPYMDEGMESRTQACR
jgi:hypothetical protein